MREVVRRANPVESAENFGKILKSSAGRRSNLHTRRANRGSPANFKLVASTCRKVAHFYIDPRRVDEPAEPTSALRDSPRTRAIKGG